MLLEDSIRTFPCPGCGAILTTGVASCDVCAAPIDAQAAEAAAERRDLVLRANGEASSLVIAARLFLPFFGLSFVPFLSPVGRFGILALLVQVPWLSARWYRRYGKLGSPEPELDEARKWWRESLAIWLAVLAATAVWFLLLSGGRR